MKKFIVFLIAVLVLSACSNSRLKPQPNFGNVISEFESVDQHNKTFTNKDMKRKVWLIDFIFTNCETVCPPMTYNMSQVIDDLEKEGVKDYGILSFSVDPKVDTPEKLNTYLNEHGDNSKGKWKAITGYDEKFIRQIAEESFKTIVAPPTKDNNQATHGTSFYLVDQNSRLIKSYSGTDTGDKKFPKAEIVEDVKLQIKQGPYEK